ncbi:MAG TPA: TerC family protein [Burkholderiales bacterium]|jgi:predicted tellurium resistance membrane protein TerC|nr:TerC family protein [Burkholderiales bacterium]
MNLLADPQAWLAFVTLVALELVLGIDNIVFISILADKLPAQRREAVRRLGLLLAMLMRIVLLALLAWLVGLTAPLFEVLGRAVSGRDLILLGGGLFLLWKSTTEIHHLFQGEEGGGAGAVPATVGAVLVQIALLDIVFSLDSIITAVGMVDEIEIMVAAVIVSVGLMMAFAGPVGRFISARPTLKMLALSFLLMIGLVLIADGLGVHVPKAYVYFAMAFSVLVEMLNLRLRRKSGRRAER